MNRRTRLRTLLFLVVGAAYRGLTRAQRIGVGATAMLSSVLLHQWMPLIVGAVALARAFAADAHPSGDRRMLALFVALVVTLSLLGTLPVSLPR